jgi:hypothetical protein
MKIFWAWQSDTPGRTGRHLVRAALLEAVNELKQPDEIDEPTTAENREAMHVDQDRQGVAGSPGLADTIKRKIEAAAVFHADITPVSRIPRRRDVKGSREKRNMNPNVAIELGYALHALGEHHVLLILNEHYSGREFIPFDLQHLGSPIIYSLDPKASAKDIEAAKARLKGQLVVALREYLKAPKADAAPEFRAVPSTSSRAVWFQPGAVLARLDATTEYGFVDDSGVYLRVARRTPLSDPISTADLYGLPGRLSSASFIASRPASRITTTTEQFFLKAALRVDHYGQPLKCSTTARSGVSAGPSWSTTSMAVLSR